MCCTWSPANAMQAYMHSLQLWKEYCCKEQGNWPKTTSPACTEYISALAAGKQARLMVDVEVVSVTPSALALAVAAKHNRGRLICIRREEATLEEARRYLEAIHLQGFVEFKLAENAAEVVRHVQLEGSVDFAVIDSRLEGCPEILSSISMNPNGSVVVVVISNLFDRSGSDRTSSYTTYAQVAQGRCGGGLDDQLIMGAKSAVLPIGDGIFMEVTKINGNAGSSGRLHSSAGGGKRLMKRRFLVCESETTTSTAG